MKSHPYRQIDPFKIPEVADKLLNDYWDIAEGLKINSFLHYGTCLGFVRGDGYIIGDNDIDVGILEGIKELAAKLIENGFVKKRSTQRSWHFLKYNMLLDIHFNLGEGKYFRSFDKVTYKGRAYNVPYPIGEFLKAKYGNWKTKKHNEVVGGIK